MSDEKLRFFPNKSQAPPGGWRFTVDETGVRLQGTTMGELMTNVNKHLEVNELPEIVGLDSLIEQRICDEVPTYCSGSGPELKPVMSARRRTIHEVISGTKTIGSWLVQRAMGKGTVEPEEASRRAKICIGCAENQEPTGCSSCNMAAKNQILERLVPFAIAEDGQLKSCRPCGCMLSVKVKVAKEILVKNMPGYVSKELPGHCWLKEEGQ